MEWFQKNFVRLTNQEKLAYIDTQVGEKTIVLLHGNLSSSVHWTPLIHALKSSYRVIAFDMRGFGDSTYAQSFDHLDTLAEDIREALTLLNITSYNVVGWSAGGGVAMSLSTLDERVEKLVLLSSMSYKGLPVFQKDDKGQIILNKPYPSKQAMGEDPIQVKPLVEAIQQNNMAFMKTVWDYFIYTVQKPSAIEDEVYLKASLQQRNLVDIDWAIAHFHIGLGHNGYVEGDGRVQSIRIPVLSIWGQQDKTVLEWMVRETVFALGQQATLKIYDACGHSPVVDQLETLTQDIRQFIG